MTIRPDQPPFPVDLIADLHAGNLPDEVAEQLWPQVRRDDEAAAVLSALDNVTARLHELGHDHNAAVPIPDAVRARLERALAEAPPLTPVGTALPASAPVPPPGVSSLDDARARRTARRARYLVAAAAAVVVVASIGGTLGVLRANDNSSSRPTAARETSVPSSDTDLGTDLHATTVMAAMNRHDVHGPLANQSTLKSCLAAVGADRAVVGSMSVVFRGQDAVLVLVAGTVPGKITALVVPPGCSAADHTVLAHAEF